MSAIRSLLFLLLAVSTLGVSAGCGSKSEGPARHHVSGSVTYDGKPVPRGTIMFLPDTSKGTEGPASKVEIINGKYDSRMEGSSAPISGELLVQVNGFGPAVANEEFPAPLFTMHETTFTMPSKDTTFDIDVPASR